MRQEDKLKEKIGTRLPYSVPEGYFASFKNNLMHSLPEYPEKPHKVKLSAWQRVKPYVYLAAMFAGIWCMMQIFHRVNSVETDKTEFALTYEAIHEAENMEYYVDNSSGADLELQDEVLSLYPSLDEFKRDFYAQL